MKFGNYWDIATYMSKGVGELAECNAHSIREYSEIPLPTNISHDKYIGDEDVDSPASAASWAVSDGKTIIGRLVFSMIGWNIMGREIAECHLYADDDMTGYDSNLYVIHHDKTLEEAVYSMDLLDGIAYKNGHIYMTPYCLFCYVHGVVVYPVRKEGRMSKRDFLTASAARGVTGIIPRTYNLDIKALNLDVCGLISGYLCIVNEYVYVHESGARSAPLRPHLRNWERRRTTV